MSETLEQYFEKHSALSVLVKNLKINLDNLTDLSESEKKVLMRMNLIMIRQCLKDCGVE